MGCIIIIMEKYMELKNLYVERINVKLPVKNLKECSGNNALKSNLSSYIKMEKESDTQYSYYISITETFYYKFKFNILEESKGMENKNRLEITARIIVEFYKNIILYYQKEISNLKIYSLYKENNKEELEKLEKLIRYISLFLIKLYFEFPLREENETSKICDELMEKYHIKEQVSELRSKLNLIRKISTFKYNERMNDNREKWNTRFAIIGIFIAIVDIVCNFIN